MNKSSNLPEIVRELGERVRGESELDNLDEGLYIVLCEVAREYLQSASVEPGYTRGSLWGMLQSLHENLEEDATDYDPSAPSRMIPNRPTASVVRHLKSNKPTQPPQPKEVMPTFSDLMEMAQAGILVTGFRFYDHKRRSDSVAVVEVTVHRHGGLGSAVKSLSYTYLDPKTNEPIGRASKSPSEAIRDYRGTVTNPYDTWRTESGKTFRELVNEFRKSRSA